MSQAENYYKEMVEKVEAMEADEQYTKFEKKFKPKRTTDDCITPPLIYETVKNWAVKEYGWEGREIVRPFYPGGDYENYAYPKECVVIDNPPFSILSKIVRFYEEKQIDYFLFAPNKTLFSIRAAKSRIGVKGQVVYDNGAKVNTAFVCSRGATIRTAPTLQKALDEAIALMKREKLGEEPPVYAYPENLVTFYTLEALAKGGREFATDNCVFISALDAQREKGKTIYGSGYLVSDKTRKR